MMLFLSYFCTYNDTKLFRAAVSTDSSLRVWSDDMIMLLYLIILFHASTECFSVTNKFDVIRFVTLNKRISTARS